MMPSLQELPSVSEEGVLGQNVVSMETELHSCSPIHPSEGATCMVTISTENTDLDPNYCCYGFGDLEIQLGEGDSDICDIIDSKLSQMKENETCRIILSKATTPDKDGHGDVLSLKITLKSFKCLPEIFQLDSEAKFRLATHHKNKGVELFKQGNTVYAFRRFSRALKYSTMMLPVSKIDNSHLASECQKLRCQCFNNMAACQLKAERYDFVIQNCSKALNLECGNVKALYRRAEAYFRTECFRQAKADVLAGLKIEPKSKSFHMLLNSINEKLSVADGT